MDSATQILPAPPSNGWVSNAEFGRDCGVHFTTASRYRNGERVPSTRVARKMARKYNLDSGELLDAIEQGREYFGHYVRMRVFGPEPEVDLNPDGSEKIMEIRP